MMKDKDGKIILAPSIQPNEGQLKMIDRRYGAFLHFGVNTFNNLEWSEGTLPIESYKPDSIDADSWVRTAYEAGMNYAIAISKHHDGFCMWDTKSTDYCVRCSSNETDVVREISNACQKYGIGFAVYYSLWDRNQPSYRNDFSTGYISYMLRQLEELLDGRYGEVVELWLDGPWDKLCAEWRYDLIYDLVKRYQPNCQIAINHTIGRQGLGDPEDRYKPQNQQDHDPIRNFPSDFRLWDSYMAREDDPKIFSCEGKDYYLPFEHTICNKEGFSWFNSDIYESKNQTDCDYIAECYNKCVRTNNTLIVNLPPNVHGKLSICDIDNVMKVAQILKIKRTWSD